MIFRSYEVIRRVIVRENDRYYYQWHIHCRVVYMQMYVKATTRPFAKNQQLQMKDRSVSIYMTTSRAAQIYMEFFTSKFIESHSQQKSYQNFSLDASRAEFIKSQLRNFIFATFSHNLLGELVQCTLADSYKFQFYYFISPII